jgi:hypothetical protein
MKIGDVKAYRNKDGTYSVKLQYWFGTEVTLSDENHTIRKFDTAFQARSAAKKAQCKARENTILSYSVAYR